MATHKKQAAKPTKNAKASATKAKKAAPAKKVVASKTKGTPAKKAAKPTAKPVAKKASKPAPKKAVKTVKKAAPAKKAAPGKTNSKNIKKPVSKATTSKAKPAKKAVPAKKAAPAKKVAPAAKKAAPAKKVAPAPKKAVPVAKKAAPAPKVDTKKAAPAKPVKEAKEVKKAPLAKAQDAPVKGSPKNKAPGKGKAPVKKVIVQTITHTPSRPLPNRQAIREEKKPNVIIAHRRLENKSKSKDEGRKTMVSYQPETYRSILDEPQQQTGPVYRYSDEELNEFKELISGRLEAARKELVYLQGLITRKDEAGTEDTENPLHEYGRRQRRNGARATGTTCQPPDTVYQSPGESTDTHRKQNLWYLPRNG